MMTKKYKKFKNCAVMLSNLSCPIIEVFRSEANYYYAVMLSNRINPVVTSFCPIIELFRSDANHYYPQFPGIVNDVLRAVRDNFGPFGFQVSGPDSDLQQNWYQSEIGRIIERMAAVLCNRRWWNSNIDVVVVAAAVGGWESCWSGWGTEGVGGGAAGPLQLLRLWASSMQSAYAHVHLEIGTPVASSGYLTSDQLKQSMNYERTYEMLCLSCMDESWSIYTSGQIWKQFHYFCHGMAVRIVGAPGCLQNPIKCRNKFSIGHSRPINWYVFFSSRTSQLNCTCKSSIAPFI